MKTNDAHKSQWLAAKLRMARKSVNMNQEQVAEHVGVTRGAVTQWESRNAETRTQPRLDQLQKVAELYRLPIGYLIEDKFPVSDMEHVRTMHCAGQWQDMPAVVEGGAPPGWNIRSASMVEPIGGFLHTNALDTPPDERVNDPFPRMTMAERFWQAVAWHMTQDNSASEPYFDVRINVEGLRRHIDFLAGDNVVEFGAIEPLGTFTRRIASLLLEEKILKRPMRKHLLLWSPEARPVDEAAHNLAILSGVEVRIFSQTEPAIQYLQGLIPRTE